MSIGVVTKADKKALFVTSWTIPLDSKHTEACFSPNSTDSLCLLVAQVPRSWDMANFFANDNNNNNDNNDDTTDYFTLCACARGNDLINIYSTWIRYSIHRYKLSIEMKQSKWLCGETAFKLLYFLGKYEFIYNITNLSNVWTKLIICIIIAGFTYTYWKSCSKKVAHCYGAWRVSG